MFAVPWVRCPAFGGDHLFVSWMACDFWPAVWNGNVYYGFNKELCNLTWAEGRFVVSAGEAPSLVAACRTIDGNAQTLLEWMRRVAALPVLGAREDGSRVQSRFGWRVSDAAVECASVHAVVNKTSKSIPDGRYEAGDALLVRGMRWRLGWPAAV